MIMDPSARGFVNSINGLKFDNQNTTSVFTDRNFVALPQFQDGFLDHSFGEPRFLRPDCGWSNAAMPLTTNSEYDSPEDCDFSDIILNYISQMLMEEDMEDKTCMFHESLDLQAAEKSFYEVLGRKYQLSPSRNPSFGYRNSGNLDDILYGNGNGNFVLGEYNSCEVLNFNNNGYENCIGDRDFVSSNWIQDLGEDNSCEVQNFLLNQTPQSSIITSNTISGFVESPVSTLQVPDSYSDSQSAWQFRKGVEEANKFLPNCSKLELKSNLKTEEKCESRGRKNPNREDVDSIGEERSSKQAAISSESILRSQMFDDVLLCGGGKPDSPLAILRESLQNGTNKNIEKSGQTKGSKGRGKKQSGKKEVVDLRTLLTNCAQAVAADDRRVANELLKKIRMHSSAFGDGTQRLAHCFADGLEARLAGTGSHIYKALVSKRTSAADLLKAYHLYCAACPFRKFSNFFSNRTIHSISEKATRVHIIDFGIHYGFQWPTFIQRLSGRVGGPPKLRITGVDFPQPGFRPSERIEETGRRLADYARSFNVPFEYNAIAKKWETIQLEDFKIDRDEVLAVNCLYRFRNLHDETVAADSSRDLVLKLIRKINPGVFIHGIVNGAYNAPFFVTRFREALFHFSSLFDMLETNVPREDWERMLIEKEIFGREALNVIACEGWERVERPETYKQWQVRNLRAGFVQRPLDRFIMEKVEEKVRMYHKDFVIDEDCQWLLQGWKGRIIYALSSWKPV